MGDEADKQPMDGRSVVSLVDMVFPGDTNHHGTLFGGVALAHMDKIAFIAASRHGRASFVTASSERVDFTAAARKGELVEATATIARVGRSSIQVEVELVAEALLTGERRRCTHGLFTLVAVKDGHARLPLPPLAPALAVLQADADLRMVDMVFPPQTNHYGTLFGGDALSMLGKTAFIVSTRHARAVMVMASCERVDFRSPVREGELIELTARIVATGRTSVTVGVDLWAESLLSGERRKAASATFHMVTVGPDGRPQAIAS
jgi:acyl-CoA hydrolase